MSRELRFKRTVAQAIVAALDALAVKRVFGLPGIQNIELFEELAQASFETTTPTNESAAAFMADAYARTVGALGVLIVTAGPGLTNALTGIAEAALDSSPLLVIVSAKSASLKMKFQLHQIPQAELVRPLVKKAYQPSTPDEVIKAIFEAAALAQAGEPGPTLVEVPADLLMNSINFSYVFATPPPPSLDGALLERVALLLRQSRAPGIYVGAGAFGAAKELLALAELLEAPVATTISGRGIIPEDHPLAVGYGFGKSSSLAAWRTFRKVQTLLAIGCRYGEVATGSYGMRLPVEHIHIDINPTTLEANYPAAIAVQADAREAIIGLLKRLEDVKRAKNSVLRTRIETLKAERERSVTAAIPQSVHVSPARFLRALRSRMKRDAILTTDSGSHQFWSLSDFPVYEPRTFLSPTDFQAMGFSIPAAIAAKLAHPERQVVSLVGDGGFLMSGFECLNAVKLKLGVVIVVFCDGAWGLIQDAQRRVYRRAAFTEIANPNYRLLAESLGMTHVQIASDRDIEGGLDAVLAQSGSCLVEVNVQYTHSPDYVIGASPQLFKSLPLNVQFNVARRFVSRCVWPKHDRGQS